MIVRKSFCLLLLAANFSLVGSVSFAAPAPPVPPAFKQKLAANETKLKALELKATSILSRKTISVADKDIIDKEMDAYAEQMNVAAEEAMREADKAAKSGGREGNTASLASFENMAKTHERRANNLAKNFERIEASIKKGAIVFEKPLLMKMSPVERNEFKKGLAPEAIKKMEGLHPGIFTTGMSMNFFDFNREQIGCAVKSTGSMLADGIGDFFVSDAEARYYAACILPCNAGQWQRCVICLADAKRKSDIAKREYWQCRNSCKWWQFLCKARCLAVLIGKLA